jgi:hypothetical protein
MPELLARDLEGDRVMDAFGFHHKRESLSSFKEETD